MATRDDRFANDARLTAYALGQLESCECAELEKRLAVCESMQREVDEIRAVAELLGAAYETAPSRESDAGPCVSRPTLAFAAMGVALAASLFLATNLPTPSAQPGPPARSNAPALLGPWAPPVHESREDSRCDAPSCPSPAVEEIIGENGFADQPARLTRTPAAIESE